MVQSFGYYYDCVHVYLIGLTMVGCRDWNGRGCLLAAMLHHLIRTNAPGVVVIPRTAVANYVVNSKLLRHVSLISSYTNQKKVNQAHDACA